MGSGIAQVAAQSGHQVTLVDVNEAACKKSLGGIEKNLARIVKKKYADDIVAGEKWTLDTLSRLSTSVSAVEAAKTSDLVVEAITENLEIKRKLFAELDKVAPASTLFASNTSSIKISEIAKATQRADRFGGLHFFNPVPVMKLLEVVTTPELSQASYKQLCDFGVSVGKTPITCKDTPGFVVNRLLVPYMFEAIRMFERGEASIDDIDTGMKLGCGYPMGPFELCDYVGLDTIKFVMDGWSKQFPGNPLFFPSPLLDSMVASGKLGHKSGEGFRKWSK